MKKGSLILLLSLAFVAFCTCQVYADTSERWKVGHLRQSGSAIDKDLHQFIEQINSKTENKFFFDVYPGNRLGDYSIVQERVSFGEVQLYVGPLATSIDKRLIIATTPYLVNSWSEARQVYSQGSDLFTTTAEFLKEQNIKLLGGWPVYFGGIGLREKPPEPGNPDVSKKMIIRVPPIRSFELAAKELGYTPYPITWTYAKMGLKTGMVDGIIGGGAEGYSNLKETIKYYIPVKDHFEYWFMYMNLDSWKELSKEEQDLFVEAAKKMEVNRYLVAESQEKESIQSLKKQGIQVIELSDKELKAMREKIQKKVWPQLEEEIGPEFGRVLSDIQQKQ
ncbi:MAG: C4-dicarboxylate ABC transporter [Desulfobulbaceae bacterium]|nr:C4-dicarboxylate ABC transporter [Desulfobulbaceae bacterium]